MNGSKNETNRLTGAGTLRAVQIDWSGQGKLFGRTADSTDPFSEEELAELIREGIAEVVFEGRNTVTDWGLSLWARFPLWAAAGGGGQMPIRDSLGNTDVVTNIANAKITEMKFGDASGGSAPNITDRQLHDSSPVISVPVAASYFPATAEYAKIRFSGSLPASFPASGSIVLYEEGLFFKPDGVGEVLFARVVMPGGVTKTSGVGLQFDHIIALSNL
jgi:hypothetical protein